MQSTTWNCKGSNGELMHGNTHMPEGEAEGVVLLGHGFKGYKDYGMFPWLANKFSKRGFIAHRFNYSHSGMTAGDGPFERPDLFKEGTWNTQVDDLAILCDTFMVDGLPTYLLGHSRGGVACLLSSGRGDVDVAGVLSLSAPSTCNPLAKETQDLLLKQGYVESPSSRTNQMLHIGASFLQEQLDDPSAHNLLSLVESFESPVLIVHGEDDPTVSVESAVSLAAALKHPTLVRVPKADHVFNTPNPFPIEGTPSAQLQTVWDAIERWL
jgi:uncharacterized protein